MEASKLRTGVAILLEGQPYQVVTYMLRPNSRGAAKMVTKLKNLLTGSTVEKTFGSGDVLDDADIAKARAQYLYNDGTNYIFMDNDTYEQFEFSSEKIGDDKDFLVDNMEVNVMKFNDNPINIELPPTITLEIVQTDPGVRGDTATGGTKPATLETGVVVAVPLFVNQGEKIVVNTLTREYKERAK